MEYEGYNVGSETKYSVEACACACWIVEDCYFFTWNRDYKQCIFKSRKGKLREANGYDSGTPNCCLNNEKCRVSKDCKRDNRAICKEDSKGKKTCQPPRNCEVEVMCNKDQFCSNNHTCESDCECNGREDNTNYGKDCGKFGWCYVNKDAHCKNKTQMYEDYWFSYDPCKAKGAAADKNNIMLLK